MNRLREDSIFRTLFAAYPDALLVVDASGSIVLANPAASALLGYDMEEFEGLGVDELVPDAIRPRHAAYRSAYALSPTARPMGTQRELVAKCRDGSEVMVEIALSPLQDQGAPYTVAAVRGVATYPRVKQALVRARYSEHLANFGRLAADARDAGPLLREAPRVAAEALELDGVVIAISESADSQLRVAAGVGMLADENVGGPVSDTLGSVARAAIDAIRPILIEDLSRPSRTPATATWREAGLMAALAVPVVDRGRPVGAIVGRSRAARSFGNEEVRFLESLSSLLIATLQRTRSEDQLAHQQRLESVGQLTGGIAHDFNNLLTVMSGNLQAMQDMPSVERDVGLQQMIAAASRAAARGAELTGKLLAFSRRQVLQPRRIEAAALLESLAGMLRRTMDQRIAIDVNVELDCPAVLADPSQLESAMLNLAINARDAMADGGRLSFDCRRAEPPDALSSELHEDCYVAISVCDTGCGMPESVRQRAFEPFFTTKEGGRGTGLGLATVYGFARQSRGAITLDSAEGQGTTFRLYLPLARREEPRSGDDERSASTLPPGLSVLLVEDDAEVRAVVGRFLESLGCKVTSRANAEQALPLLRSDDCPDLMLTDIALGSGMRGTELAQHARELHPELPVLLMTGFSSGVVTTPPGWQLLHKPYTRAELARAMAQVIGAAA